MATRRLVGRGETDITTQNQTTGTIKPKLVWHPRESRLVTGQVTTAVANHSKKKRWIFGGPNSKQCQFKLRCNKIFTNPDAFWAHFVNNAHLKGVKF